MLAGFDVLYQPPTATRYTTKLETKVVYSQPIKQPFCYYQMIGDNKNRNYLTKYLEREKLRVLSIDEYVKLARKTIYEYIKNNTIIEVPYNLNKKLLEEKHGVFVSIHKFDRLRGCIGTILPVTENVATEIIRNAIAAATQDPRFNEISEDELDYLEINVDVLTEPEDIDNKNLLDPKKYGVIVISGYKRGLLLPDLEGIDDIDTQISIAKQKANITEDEEIKLQRFEVIRHK
jgi:AmmeMemoRadiSam system protein A